MDTVSHPLTRHAPDAVLAYKHDGPVSVARFIAEARALAKALPAGRHILNTCLDRYRFMTGFAAGLIANKITLLPSTHTPESIRQMKAFAPDVFCLCDDDSAIDLPQIRYPASLATAPVSGSEMPLIAGGEPVAYVFTSGSTGKPIAHAKTWHSLVCGAEAEAARLGLDVTPCSIVGTVPSQHMYGLESTVMLALHGNCSCWAGRPFYPADIAAALALTPEPRLLVTTPFHLRALLDEGGDMPRISRILSATAPLSVALAERAERVFNATLHEIYGCTETGQLATRQTTQSLDWQLLPGIELAIEGEQCFARGGHVYGQMILSDLIELLPGNLFRLHGRSNDLINIAGKRTSLAYLNHQLAAIPHVEEGCFFNPEESSETRISRLCAVVVAPEITARQILEALRERIDPVFLPRPLIFVDCLPRNATGKLPRDELLAILRAYQNKNTPILSPLHD